MMTESDDADRRPELLPNHRADLHASGLTDDTIAVCGFYSCTDATLIGKHLNRSGPANELGPCLVFPYLDADGNPTGYATVKPDKPPVKNGMARKYLNPSKAPERVYLAPGTGAVARDVSVPIIITEDVKKTAAADQHGFPCLGLAGVECWSAPRETGADGRKRSRRELHPDLARLPWVGRIVRIIYDSDAAEKPEVMRAERALATALRRIGARVRVVRLPGGADDRKVGLDDYLLASGPEALRELLEEAAPGPESAAGGEGGDGGEPAPVSKRRWRAGDRARYRRVPGEPRSGPVAGPPR